jgi:O-acetyl-ADP-ribose deacetylase (regulator of RNase III)
MIQVTVQQGSIADADADVLVNASNTILRLGSGVSAAIRASCGRGFQEELDALLAARHPGGLEPGAVVITGAGTHRRARWVAHVAVMDYRDRPDAQPLPTLARIERGTRALWQQVESLPSPAVSVAIVALGAGTGGLGLRDSVEIACRTLQAHLEAHPASRITHVTFVAWALHEHANTIAVVHRHFPQDLAALDPDLRRLVENDPA